MNNVDVYIWVDSNVGCILIDFIIIVYLFTVEKKNLIALEKKKLIEVNQNWKNHISI